MDDLDVVTVTGAAKNGTRRDMLVATRDRIATAVDDQSTAARDLAALTKRLIDIAKEIEAIDAADAEDDLGRAHHTPDEAFDPATL